MNAPERLLAGEATEFERELLGTWSRRQPSAEARAKVLTVAGAGLGVAVLSSASATAAKVASTSIAPKAVFGWSAALVKWLAVGLVGATATAGAVAYVSRHSELSVASPEVPAVTAAATAATHPAPGAATTAEPAATIELGPDMAPAVKAKSPASARSSTLDEEVGSIDQARLAVTHGDAPTALQIVSAYDAKFPNGALAQESAEIRIEALLAEGHRAAAERLAAKFIAAHPTSPYVHRIHALLGEPSSDTKKP